MRITDAELKTLYLNDRKAGKKHIREMISALNDRTIRTEKGGYLFKAASSNKNLYLGIIPCMISGERTHHYDIALPESMVHVLTGSLTPEGLFTILFIPKQITLSDEMRLAYHSAYIDLAAGLLGRGLTGPGELDGVSRMMLESSGVMNPAPSSLIEILSQSGRSFS